MAAPSRSINYRKGVVVDMAFDEKQFNDLMRAFKKLPPAATRELRDEARQIGRDLVIPEILQAMGQTAPSFAGKLGQSVRVGRDRKVKVIVGQGRKGPKFSGGASTYMVRYGSIVGPYIAKGSEKTAPYHARKDGQAETWQMWPQQVDQRWTKVASDAYTERAFVLWEKAATDIVDKWNRGSDY